MLSLLVVCKLTRSQRVESRHKQFPGLDLLNVVADIYYHDKHTGHPWEYELNAASSEDAKALHKCEAMKLMKERCCVPQPGASLFF